MVGSTGGDWSSDPRIGMVWSKAMSSSLRSSSFDAFCASSLLIGIWPWRAAVVHTGLRPTSFAICAQVRPFLSFTAAIFSVTCDLVIDALLSLQVVRGGSRRSLGGAVPVAL